MAESNAPMSKRQAWVLRNREKLRLYLRAWQARNKDKMSAYRRKWVSNNRERFNAYCREWQRKNYLAKGRERDRLWRSKNRLKSNATRYAWRAKNPEKVRRVRSRVAAERKAIFLKCKISDVPAVKKIYARCQELRQWFDVSVDHIIPLACGGAHSPENLQIIYSFENHRKRSSLTYKPTVIFT